jgi:predicted ABC-type sugar transport system permease subunit
VTINGGSPAKATSAPLNSFEWIGNDYLGPVPWLVVIALAVIAVCWFILRRDNRQGDDHQPRHRAEVVIADPLEADIGVDHRGALGPVPWLVVIALAVIAVCWFILRRTTLGVHIYALITPPRPESRPLMP